MNYNATKLVVFCIKTLTAIIIAAIMIITVRVSMQNIISFEALQFKFNHLYLLCLPTFLFVFLCLKDSKPLLLFETANTFEVSTRES